MMDHVWDTSGMCVINYCGREQGSGTWCTIVYDSGPMMMPLCEEHWAAIREIYPVPPRRTDRISEDQ